MRCLSSDVCQELVRGGLAGFAATLPMTIAMQGMNRWLPGREPLPPRAVTIRAAEKADVEQHLGEPARQVATLVAHFGMGTTLGALYGLAGRRLPLGPTASGAVFGLLAFGGNYLGLLPGLGLGTPATHYPPRQNILLVASHLVWGVVAGKLAERLFSTRLGR